MCVFSQSILQIICCQLTPDGQNVEGAGGLVGAHYLGEVAPKDGTTIGFLTAIAWNYASRPDTFRLDFRTYEFAGYTVQRSTTGVPMRRRGSYGWLIK